jgi:adenine-specific DNA-methyltransferase
VYRTTNAQTSIRTRVIEFRKEKEISDDVLSIEYVPRSGKNKGVVYEQFYKDADCNLFVWLRDTSEVIDGELYKKDLQGTLWDFVGETKNLTHEGEVSFPNGKKPVKLIKQIISMVTTDNDIVLDFFSGSATTAHSVMQQNIEDGGTRKYIMVQIPEKCDESSDSYKEGFRNICDIGKERIRRAGRKIKEEAGVTATDLDIGFRVLRLDSSNMEDVYYNPNELSRDLLGRTVDNIKIDRSSEDLLFQVMLDLGVDLSSSIEEKTIDGKKVLIVRPESIDKEYLVCCFDQGVTSETVTAIAKMQPYYAVFRDGGIVSDSVATNFDQIFRTYSPQTERKVL